MVIPTSPNDIHKPSIAGYVPKLGVAVRMYRPHERRSGSRGSLKKILSAPAIAPEVRFGEAWGNLPEGRLGLMSGWQPSILNNPDSCQCLECRRLVGF